MKVYRWEESPDYYYAIVRPDSLFDLTKMIEPEPRQKETYVEALHIPSGEIRVFAYAFEKSRRIEFVRAIMARTNELFVKKDMADVEAMNSMKRKTA